MSELEDSTEHLQEKIHEEAHHAGQDAKSKWIMSVALFTALISVLAALTGMLSGHQENESLITQMKASDQWNYYQAKGIKMEIVSSANRISHLDDSVSIARVEKYKTDQAEIKKSADEFEAETKGHLSHHVNLAYAVTLFQVAIAISAIAILTRKKFFWHVGIFFSIIAIYFMIQGLM